MIKEILIFGSIALDGEVRTNTGKDVASILQQVCLSHFTSVGFFHNTYTKEVVFQWSCATEQV